MKRSVQILLVIIAIVCFGVALSYPIGYLLDAVENKEDMMRITEIRDAGREIAENDEPTPGILDEEDEILGQEKENGTEAIHSEQGEASEMEDEARPEHTNTEYMPVTDSSAATTIAVLATESPAATPSGENVSQQSADMPTATQPKENSTCAADTDAPAPQRATAVPAGDEAGGCAVEAGKSVTATPAPSPSPTPDRRERVGALPYPEKEKKALDESQILPEYRELYEMNNDMVGWLTIPGTTVDYPVVQSADSEYYLTHDFFGKKNANGQIILDERCDPYTPSYNLVISGHNMKNSSMFGVLRNYRTRSYWEKRSIVYFDTLTEHREYVIFAAFFSADYDVDEEGFRYNADIQYQVDAERWLKEIEENQVYDTGIDAEFGDEFLTLTTCNHTYRRGGRFVLVCRRIREGETF